MNLNNNKFCLACFGKPEKDFVLIKHHVKYFPEEIGYVHYKCHEIIHNPDDPRFKHLIQFQEGDSRKFYELKKKMIAESP